MNFGNTVAEIQQKYERERGKSGREKILNFSNGVTEIPAAQISCPSVSCGVLPKNQLRQCHCRNRKKKLVIVAMPFPKMGGKKNWNGIVFFLSIVAMSLSKMGGKKNCGCRNLERNLKKKSVTFTIFLQYFHNKS